MKISTGGRFLMLAPARGIAHGIFPDAMVVCDDHGSLRSQRAAHPSRFLSGGSAGADEFLKLKRLKASKSRLTTAGFMLPPSYSVWRWVFIMSRWG